MMQVTLEERKSTVLDTLNTPNVAPEALCDTAWQVALSDVLFDPDKTVSGLALPWAYIAMERVANDPDLRAEGHPAYLDARIAIACSGIFYALAVNQSVYGEIQQTAARNIGALLTDTTGGSYGVDTLKDDTRQKIHEAITLALLLRNSEDEEMFAVPSPPFTHSPEFWDEENDTINHHIYGVGTSSRAPIQVTEHLDEEIMHMQGILPVKLGSMLISSVQKIPTMLARSEAQGGNFAGQTWLINQVARGLALEGSRGPGSAIQPLLQATTSHLNGLVKRFNPRKRQVPGGRNWGQTSRGRSATLPGTPYFMESEK